MNEMALKQLPATVFALIESQRTSSLFETVCFCLLSLKRVYPGAKFSPIYRLHTARKIPRQT